MSGSKPGIGVTLMATGVSLSSVENCLYLIMAEWRCPDSVPRGPTLAMCGRCGCRESGPTASRSQFCIPWMRPPSRSDLRS